MVVVMMMVMQHLLPSARDQPSVNPRMVLATVLLSSAQKLLHLVLARAKNKQPGSGKPDHEHTPRVCAGASLH